MTRKLLASYTDAPITFIEDADGKPRIAGSDLGFNVAHTAGLALLAVAADRRVGVDVERVDPTRDRTGIGELVFDPATSRRLAGASAGSFFTHWARLEALGKCRGTGLREQMALDPREGEVIVDVDAGPDYAAALAVAPGPVRIRLLSAEA
jgi:4'-phosphopantetheinyl transferase